LSPLYYYIDSINVSEEVLASILAISIPFVEALLTAYVVPRNLRAYE